MKTIIRNFFSVIRRFKLATMLNLLGLSVAFAAFMVIVMQVHYDLTFDKCLDDYECIYRVDLDYGNKPQAVLSPGISTLIKSECSAHVKQVAMTANSSYTDIVKIGDLMFREQWLSVEPTFTDVMGFRMLAGSAKSLEEPDKVLVSESFALKYWGTAGPDAIGKPLHEYDNAKTVGGIYQDFPENSSVRNVIYLGFNPQDVDQWIYSWAYCIYLKLDSPDSKETVLNSAMKVKRQALEILGTLGDNDNAQNSKINISNIHDLHFRNDVVFDSLPKASSETTSLLIAIAILIVVIAGINFTNFSTAISPLRVKSINTQKILGANVNMLKVSLMLEAVSVCIIAWLLSLSVISCLSGSIIDNLVDNKITLDGYGWLIALSCAVAVTIGIFSGIYPALYTTSFQPALVLKGSFGQSPKGRLLRSVLVGFQFITSFVLIVIAMFMFLQNRYMRTNELGYDTDEIISTDMSNITRDKQSHLMQQARQITGVEAVAVSSEMLACSDSYMLFGRGNGDKHIDFICIPVTCDFLKVMGIKILQGRDFQKHDDWKFIFNNTAAKQFPDRVFVGNDLSSDEEILGICSDLRYASFRMEVAPMAFVAIDPDKQTKRTYFDNKMLFRVSKGVDKLDVIKQLKELFYNADPYYLFDFRFYDEVLNNTYHREGRTCQLVLIFSVLAIFISVIGVFGLVVFESEYRRKEIGVRRVMGASVNSILMMFNKAYVRVLLICFVISIPISIVLINIWLQNFVYKTPIYWWVFALALLLISVITLTTVTFQSFRSANDNPVDSLKNE